MRGFTLIEVLVAFAILTVSLGVFLQVFSGGLDSARSAESYAMAALLAESKLAAMGVEEPLTEGEQEGRFDDRFEWQSLVTPYEEEGGDSGLEGGGRLEAFEVTVTVIWKDGAEDRSLALNTLRLSSQR